MASPLSTKVVAARTRAAECIHGGLDTDLEVIRDAGSKWKRRSWPRLRPRRRRAANKAKLEAIEKELAAKKKEAAALKAALG